MADTLFTGFDLDAIYNGDRVATGDAIRLLVQLASQNKGVLPVLTDKIIVPTFTSDGLIIESEDGTRYASIGGGGGNSGVPVAGVTNWETDMNLTKRLRLGEVVDIADNFAPGETTLGLGFGDTDFVGIGNILYRLAPTGNSSVSGIYSAVDGSLEPNNNSQVAVFWNDSAFTINFDSSIAGVTNGRKILTPFYLGAQGSVILVKDNFDDGWRVLSVHNPTGLPWISIPHGSITFTAATGTWTVASGDLAYCKYKKEGSHVFLKGAIVTSSVSATPTELRMTIPGVTFAGNDSFGFTVLSQDGFATQDTGQAIARVASGLLVFKPRTGVNWITTANLTAVIWNLVAECAP